MTLSRQLLLSGFFVLMCLFLGLISFVVINTQEFLNKQLASHAQDTATSLGLSLTSNMQENDAVSAERMVDAVWDSGYYQKILVENLDGEPLVLRTTEVKVHGVPEWFINLLSLEVVKQDSEVLDGWQRLGKVYIESNPGYAYEQIWKTFIESVQWFVVTGIFAAILGGVLLYIILKPLRAITQQAYEICNQQFSVLEKLPWTIDLRQVVIAMNNMSQRLKKLFEDQAKATEQYREQAFKDPVTKLGNRRYFDMQFDYILENSEKSSLGVLLLIELKDFKNYNDKHGYEAGDELLINVANLLRELCENMENVIIGHIGGASFGVVLANKTKESGNELAIKICQAFNEFIQKDLAKEQEVGHVGGVVYHPGDDKKMVLSQADMGLRQAQTDGPNKWKIEDSASGAKVKGAQEWSKIFADTIKDNKIILHYQRVEIFNNPHKVLNYELLMRLQLEDDSVVSAGIFMPMAERLHMITDLDKLVVQNAISSVRNAPQNYIFTINLSPTSLDSAEFTSWLLETLKNSGRHASQLSIELPEYGVVNRIDMVRKLYLDLAKIGVKTSIDHYGKNFNSFAYLHNLKTTYLKIDGGFIKNINENSDNQFFIRSLIDIAHSLDITVIAEAVETKEELETLKSLKVDGAQGYFIAKPGELEIS